eukprot:12901421-Ditylum_brightwellii.AAC.2
MSPTTFAQGTHLEPGIKNQFVWDDNKQKLIKEDDDDLAIPMTDKAGEKYKAVEAKQLSK